MIGAGATRGAEFVVDPPEGPGSLPKCLPPLNADFFSQLQRITTERHMEASNKELTRVIIANPSNDHRRRIRSILAPALEGGTLVTEFDSFRDFAPHAAEAHGTP